jgi:hypothetical protein
MGGFRRYKRACAALGAFALVINLLVSLAHWASPAFADSALASLVICTASGAKSIPADPSGDRHGSDHCPACMVAPIVVADAAIAITAFFPAPVSIKHAPRYVSLLPLHVDLGGIHSRAPPRIL